MSIWMDIGYAVAGVVAWPFLLRKRWKTGKYKSGLAGRFGMGEELVPVKGVGERVLLMHCVSVGELNSVQTLIGRLLAADEGLRIVVTTGTDTGTERARKLFGVDGGMASGEAPLPTRASAPLRADGGVGTTRVFAVRMPFDFSFAVERLFDRVMPDAVALVELETWPNFLEIARDRGVPVAIINGRISEKSFPRYRMIRPVMAGMLKKVTWIGAQTETIAARFVALGAEDVRVIPTLKYDNAMIGEQVAGQEELGAAMGLGAEDRLIVGGSTGPGEEEALLEMYEGLRGRWPELRLAIVPRHPEVVGQVVRAVERRGLKVVRRTERPDGWEKRETRNVKLETGEVFVLDTMGELRKMYGLAFGVFVGRSLMKKGGGGSDMIEVCAMGKACSFGPWTGNFSEVVEMLVKGGGAVVVKDGEGLMGVVEGWLKDPAGAREMGRRGQELIRGQQGSTERYVKQLIRMMGGGSGIDADIPGRMGRGDLRRIRYF